MKNGQKAAEPGMEDVLASIRRAIDENAQGPAPDRLGASMAEFRVKFDAPANQETRSARRSDQSSPTVSSPSRDFAGIFSGKNAPGETSAARGPFKPREPVPRRLEAVATPNEGQQVYHGYYGAQVEKYPERVLPPHQAPAPAGAIPPPRYLPLPPPVGQRQIAPSTEQLMSEASSGATQAAFARLAETLTRRALGERPIADIAQEMLRGMLKQWLDENLPKLVERLVREEIERVVRRPR